MSTPDLPDTAPQAPQQESLIEYPSQFPIKVMGLAGQDFDTLVIEIVKRQFHKNVSVFGFRGPQFLIEVFHFYIL